MSTRPQKPSGENTGSLDVFDQQDSPWDSGLKTDPIGLTDEPETFRHLVERDELGLPKAFAVVPKSRQNPSVPTVQLEGQQTAAAGPPLKVSARAHETTIPHTLEPQSGIRLTHTIPRESGGLNPKSLGSADDTLAWMDPEMREVAEAFAGKFRIIQQIGRGGMGSVFLVQQHDTHRRLALKVLRGMRNKKDLLRFDREMNLMASISHPNVVKVFDYGQTSNGVTYLAMEYVEGRTLFELLYQQRLLPLQQSLRIAYYTALGLGAAHEKEIIHRDVKPENIVISNHFGIQNFAQILDFGIARETKSFNRDAEQLTSGGIFLGTPMYSAPEAIRGEVLSIRTDIYSLGCLIYQLLTERCPFEDPAPLKVMEQHLKNRPTPTMRATKVETPEGLGAFVDSMLSKRPQYRPESMAVVAERLSRYMEPIAGRAVPMPSDHVPVADDVNQQSTANASGPDEGSAPEQASASHSVLPASAPLSFSPPLLPASPPTALEVKPSTRLFLRAVFIGLMLSGWILFLLHV